MQKQTMTKKLTNDTNKKNSGIKYPTFTIASAHETDLNKSIAQIEKANVTDMTSKVLQSRSVTNIAKHMDFIEKASPVLTNIMISSIPVRHSIGSRAKELLKTYHSEYDRCTKRLVELSSRNPLNLLVHNKLVKLVKVESAEFANSYVTSDAGATIACEIHTLNNVQIEDKKLPSVKVYTYKDGVNLCIASVINSKFSPKVFDTIKFSKLSDWLKTNSLVA